jgi:hypothetical protein
MKNLIFLSLIISLFIVWGCNTDQSPTTDERTLNELALENLVEDIESSETEDYFYSNLDEESEDNFFDSGIAEPTTLLKPIVPLRFGRLARPIIKDKRIIFDNDTTATVLYRKEMRGVFRILAADTTGQDTTLVYRVNKSLGHEFQRIAHFAKRGKNTEKRRGWKLIDFSMVEGQSYSSNDSTIVNPEIDIVKMVVQTDSIDVTITDPLGFFQTKKSVFKFSPETEVTVTVHVSNNTANPVIFPVGTQSTELVRLHFSRHRKFRYHGVRLFQWVGQDADNNNIYQGTWTVGSRFGVHHAVVDVIDNGTILDDDASAYPYRSVTWGTPYLVRNNF